jgi:hypothetical protein
MSNLKEYEYTTSLAVSGSDFTVDRITRTAEHSGRTSITLTLSSRMRKVE